MTMGTAIKTSAVMVYLNLPVWWTLTIGVMCMMDVLECFLHALRLHWVEFQSKFYHGDGYAFRPYKLAGQ